jgi:ankyrin repeat protein
LQRLLHSEKLSSKRSFSELYGVIEQLLDKEADPRAEDELGNTALHYVAYTSLMSAESSDLHSAYFEILPVSVWILTLETKSEAILLSFSSSKSSRFIKGKYSHPNYIRSLNSLGTLRNIADPEL